MVLGMDQIPIDEPTSPDSVGAPGDRPREAWGADEGPAQGGGEGEAGAVDSSDSSLALSTTTSAAAEVAGDPASGLGVDARIFLPAALAAKEVESGRTEIPLRCDRTHIMTGHAHKLDGVLFVLEIAELPATHEETLFSSTGKAEKRTFVGDNVFFCWVPLGYLHRINPKLDPVPSQPKKGSKNPTNWEVSCGIPTQKSTEEEEEMWAFVLRGSSITSCRRSIGYVAVALEFTIRLGISTSVSFRQKGAFEVVSALETKVDMRRKGNRGELWESPNNIFTSGLATSSLNVMGMEGYLGQMRDSSWIDIGLSVYKGVKHASTTLMGKHASESIEGEEDPASPPSENDSSTSFMLVNGEPGGQIADIGRDKCVQAAFYPRKGGEEEFEPVGEVEWEACFSDGRLDGEKWDGFREEVFSRGLSPPLRAQVWPYLLGFYQPGMSHADREAEYRAREREYCQYKQQWQSITEVQERRFKKFRDRKSRVEKDVVRTDRGTGYFGMTEEGAAHLDILNSILLTYAFYNFDVGYCQGMGDLLSPILMVLDDEVMSFWCFSAIMDVKEADFHTQALNGVYGQLQCIRSLTQRIDPGLFDYLTEIEGLEFFFCYRWVLVMFKREFSLPDVQELWERLWSCPHGEFPFKLENNFYVWVACYILSLKRDGIMTRSFDEILHYINDLQLTLNLKDILRGATEMYQRMVGKDPDAKMLTRYKDITQKMTRS